MFEGFPEETIRFFMELRFHNDKTFFDEHRSEYEKYVKQPFRAFIEAVAPTVEKISDDMELRPVKCLARINRDTRFTKDKSPYRDHLWLLFRRSGEQRETSVSYWFELSPDHVDWGLGFWGDNRPAMDAIRKRIREKPQEVLKALKAAKLPSRELDVFGERYARMAIPPDVPQSLKELYPLKSIYVKRTGVPLRTAYTAELAPMFEADILRLKPMYQLMRKAADDGMAALE